MLTINLSADRGTVYFDGTEVELQALKQFMVGVVGEAEYSANVREIPVMDEASKIAEFDIEAIRSLMVSK